MDTNVLQVLAEMIQKMLSKPTEPDSLLKQLHAPLEPYDDELPPTELQRAIEEYKKRQIWWQIIPPPGLPGHPNLSTSNIGNALRGWGLTTTPPIP